MTTAQVQRRERSAETPEEGQLSPVLTRELDAIEQANVAREAAIKRPAATPERAPRPYAYD